MDSAWDPYVDEVIKSAQGSCDQAVFIGLNGSIWRPNHTKRIPIAEMEAVNIAMGVNTGDDSYFHQNGVVVVGDKYEFIRSDEGTYYAKKDGQGYLTFQKTTTAIAMAHTKEGGQVGDTNTAVAKMCEHLEIRGY